MTEQEELSCGYCGHPPGMHPHGTRQGCWGEARALDGGWRACSCSGWQDAA